MKATVLSGVQQIRIEDKPVPMIGPGEALIKVEYCGICGSDVHAYFSGDLFPIGTVMGHEVAGTVVELGEGVRSIQDGDRVAVFGSSSCGLCPMCLKGLNFYCENSMKRTIGNSDQLDGGFAEYLWIPYPEDMLIKLPEEISLLEATFLDPIATSLHAIRLSRFKPGDNVAVLGAGPIGLLVIHLLKISGAGQIISTEISSVRSEAAIQIGADEVFNPLDEGEKLFSKFNELTDGVGPDIVFECSGVEEAFVQSLQLVRSGGQILVVGVIEEETRITPKDIVLKEIDLQGSLAFNREEFEEALEILGRGRFAVDSLVTAVIKLEQMEELGFKRLISGPQAIKILVSPQV